MSLITPMPSPNGTNYARMFILQGRDSNMAFDAAPSPMTDGHGAAQQIFAWCKEHMHGEELIQLAQMLEQFAGGEGAPTSDAANSVARKRFEERKQTHAMDGDVETPAANYGRRAAERLLREKQEFAERFPDAQRIKTDTFGQQKARPRPDAKAVADFTARFPESKRIGVA